MTIFAIVIFFWMAFHQNGSALSLFARDYTDVFVGKFTYLLFDVVGLHAILFVLLGGAAAFVSKAKKAKIIGGLFAVVGLIVIIIEMNPRVSRSSALASKATGFPIARISTKLAAGLSMDEIPYWKKGTLEKYKPSGEYVVVKFTRWAFEKFPGSTDVLTTAMKSVGETMAIGLTVKRCTSRDR